MPRGLLAPLMLLGLFACQPKSPPHREPTPSEHLPFAISSHHVGGLHNVFQVHPRLWSGSSPEAPEDFAALQKLGIRTIISVDGAIPQVHLAEQQGIRYVHLPIGYDGIPTDQAARLARAYLELPGPIYVHCHHGKHRGPAALAHLVLSCEGWSEDQARTWLRQAGTDPKYRGLFRFRPSSQAEIASAPADFPSQAKIGNRVSSMVKIDQHFENLKRFQQAQWQPLPSHPDLSAEHEATLLVELFRESRRHEQNPEPGYREALEHAEAAAESIVQELKQGKSADSSLAGLTRSCQSCHQKFRDQKPPE